MISHDSVRPVTCKLPRGLTQRQESDVIFSLPMAIVMVNRGEGEKEDGARERLNALLARAQAGEEKARNQLSALIRQTALNFRRGFACLTLNTRKTSLRKW
jgi:hypothetical protein